QFQREVTGEKTFSCAQSNISLKFSPNGKITVASGYEWDGNSPKAIKFFGAFWIGTPDGVVVKGKPSTYYVSLLHDILGTLSKGGAKLPSLSKADKEGSPAWWIYPWRSKEQIARDRLYYKMLEEIDFPPRNLYRLGLACFGPIYNWLEKITDKDGCTAIQLDDELSSEQLNTRINETYSEESYSEKTRQHVV
ncbi:MAG: hypothetical protein AAFY33_13275, partial [Cyanobacteria bacterium J06643_4]